MECSKWNCDAQNPSHKHVDTREESLASIGATLWSYAGDASITEALEGGTIEEIATSVATFLESNDGGLVVYDFDGEVVSMVECLTAFLEDEASQNRQ